MDAEKSAKKASERLGACESRKTTNNSWKPFTVFSSSGSESGKTRWRMPRFLI